MILNTNRDTLILLLSTFRQLIGRVPKVNLIPKGGRIQVGRPGILRTANCLQVIEEFIDVLGIFITNLFPRALCNPVALRTCKYTVVNFCVSWLPFTICM